MSEAPENIVPEHLRMLRAGMSQMIGKIDDLKADMIEVNERLGFLEGQYASLSRRVDQIGGDVELVKRRLELTEA